MTDDQASKYPDTYYRGIKIPDELLPNQDQPEYGFWRWGVDSALPEEPLGFRRRVVHGWAFRQLILDQRERFKGFTS